MATEMRAVLLEGAGNNAKLNVHTVPVPAVFPNEVLVYVKAAALNRADLLRRAGHYGHHEGNRALPIAGLELAGEVVEIGSEVTNFKAGDRVMAMASRAYAEYAVVDHRLAIRAPETMTWQQAASTPVSFVTAHDALTTHGRLVAGEAVLIQAVTSSAGLAATQIAKSLGAEKIFGTSGSHEKLEQAAKYGLTHPICYRDQDAVQVVNENTDNKGVDLIMDNIGGGVLQQNIDCLAIKGRLVQVGRLGGYQAEVNLDEVARKRINLIGVTFRTRTIDEHVSAVQKFSDEILPLLEAGTVAPVLDRSFPVEEAYDAQEYMKTNSQVGKITLTF